MIKKKGSLAIRDGRACLREFVSSAESLKDGDYKFIIFDENKNRALPHLSYLFGVVLKAISEQLPEHPPIEALYRYFEEVYAPLHSVIINGEKYEYFDLKSEPANEVNNVIDDIIHHATSQWGVTIKDRDMMKTPEAQEAYEDAYIGMWKNTLHQNVIHTNE